MKTSTKDVTVAFGTVLTLLTVWSFVEAFKAKKSGDQVKLLHAKVDKVLAKVGKLA